MTTSAESLYKLGTEFANQSINGLLIATNIK